MPSLCESLFTADVLHTIAYTSFLQSVRRTTAITSPLLDSDSEGIEDILSGRGREQQSAPNSPPSSLSVGDYGGSGAVGGGLEGKNRQGRDGDSSSVRYIICLLCKSVS